MRPWILAIALLAAAGCKTGASNTWIGAAAVTSAALGTAAAERAAGGCIAVCTGATFCNPATSLCEPVACDGKCGPDEHCEQTYAGSRCVPGEGPSGVSTTAQRPRNPVIAPVVTPPDPNHPSPTIVPTAEQPR